jgi:cytochrome c oxidase subunit 3
MTSAATTLPAHGARPLGIASKKLGMWLFVVSDALTFATLLVCYTYLRLGSANWPKPFELSPSILFASLMTLVLLTSSLTMVAAVHATDKGRSFRWLAATMALGALFVALHLGEWRHLIQDVGVTPWTNPWGEPLFGAVFFSVTGLHMLHVTAGVIYLGIVAAGLRAGRFERDDVEVAGLYWHFVDLVWMFVFPLVYLMAVKP